MSVSCKIGKNNVAGYDGNWDDYYDDNNAQLLHVLFRISEAIERYFGNTRKFAKSMMVYLDQARHLADRVIHRV